MPGVSLLGTPEQMPLHGLMTIPALMTWRRGKVESPYAAGVRSLIDRLPADIALSIAASAGTIRALADWPEVARREHPPVFIPVDNDLDFSFWCQDEFVAASVEPGSRPVLVRSATPKRAEDARIAEIVGHATGIEVVQSEIDFEGGNVLVGDDFILVGADSEAGFADRLPIDDRRAVHVVGTRRAVPRRSVRLVGSDGRLRVEELSCGAGRRQPVFHLDAFVTLAGRGPDGRNRVLLGDPRLAAELVDDPRIAVGPQSLAEAFDEIAEWFATRPQFAVIRNPLPVVYSEDTGLLSWSRNTVVREFAGADGLDDVLATIDRLNLRNVAVRRYYFATQNSAITLSRADGHGTVLVPTYAHGAWQCLAPAERYTAGIWRDLGFRVVELQDFHAFARKHGSAHCIFKVLAPL